ncbi:MAG TPA: 50S ribosomal protein L10 [Candidatus Pacearchaeota archaeon]|nr:50S ribosomal protein L10 [Candidatus Pacearchaeota archaeon]
MTKKAVKNIPKKKTDTVKEIFDLIKNKKTILIASIKDLPASQFQEIGKKLRGKAIVKVPKKNLIFRAIDESGNEAVKKIKEQIQNSVAILFSDLDAFDLAGELVRNKSPSKAKAGQEAPEDIQVDAGPTDLVPGPAISELGAVGIQIQIDKGKINIKEPKVIVREGEKISSAAADIMSKLDIKPFSIGFIPLSAFDTKENKLYLDIKIDREGTLEELKISFGKALPFAVDIGYICEDTIKFLIRKAATQEKAMEKFETKVEDKTEKPKEEVKEEKTKEKPAEEKSEDNAQETKIEESKQEEVKEKEK